MKIHVINPNTTQSMTASIASTARSAARSGTEIVASNPSDGPASIQGDLDIAACMPGLLIEANRYPDADAIIIACFDDPGLDVLRTMRDVPVIGIGEAAYHAASLISAKFSVVTTLTRSVPGLEANIARYGLSARCASVRASNIPVLELEDPNSGADIEIARQIGQAINEDHADSIILGCAGMTELKTRMEEQFGLPVIDGIVCAVAFAEALVAAKLSTSKAGPYAGTSSD